MLKIPVSSGRGIPTFQGDMTMKALPKAGAVFPMNFIISEKPVKP